MVKLTYKTLNCLIGRECQKFKLTYKTHNYLIGRTCQKFKFRPRIVVKIIANFIYFRKNVDQRLKSQQKIYSSW